MKTIPQRLFILLFPLLLAAVNSVRADDWKMLLDLSGTWKIDLGDNPGWSSSSFDDSKWDDIRVPAAWEDDGYPGYDGYAWYRKHFTADKSLQSNTIYLLDGYVDDVSEVYVNGHLVGFQGEFPPHFTTAYEVFGQYFIPQQYLNFGGDNVIAIRVYDQMMSGGITHGRVGLCEPREYLRPDLNLAGIWKFRTGDDMAWKEAAANDTKWSNVITPAYWESQGYKEYDGFGWYRLRFSVPDDLRGKRLILLLGKIDDVDETYLNGKLIGRTGTISAGMSRANVGDEWTQLRAYVIPSDALSLNGENVIAVRVNDVYLHGGLYDGPIGLVTREKFQKWERKNEGWWKIFRWGE
jgi:sialate O-acetylesterase